MSWLKSRPVWGVVLLAVIGIANVALTGATAYLVLRKGPQPLPMIGSEAPDFEQISTAGPLRLSSLTDAGKWVVLFSHPADFTPVCSTEMVGFAKRAKEFEQLNTQLVGLSIDGVSSHIAWMRELEDKWHTHIPFPILADVDMSVAKRYGMIHPYASGTETVRTVFIIDPKRIVRALVYYPPNCGRNLDEIVRLTTALQTADREHVVCPADWRPGAKVAARPPKTQADAEARMRMTNLDNKTWYFGEKALQ